MLGPQIDNGPSYSDVSFGTGPGAYSDLAQAQGWAPGSVSMPTNELAQAQGWAPPDAASSFNLSSQTSPMSNDTGGGGGVSTQPSVNAGGGGNPSGSGFPSGYTQKPQSIGNSGGGGSIAAPIIHHDAAWYRDNGAMTDPTYQMQRAALLGKLGDYERNVAGQVGDQNVQQVNAPAGDSNYGLLGNYWKMNALNGPLYTTSKDINGNLDYQASNALGGTMGSDFKSAMANFENQQVNGLRNQAEDFAARGMLGAGSGVFNNAHSNLQDQYNNQLGNLNSSAIQQYNNLLSNLAQQNTQANQSLTGYLGDASQRMAQADMAGLPIHP